MLSLDNSQMVECVVKRPTWYGGKPAAPGDVVSLGRADAQYAASLGRVEPLPPPSADKADETTPPAAPAAARRQRKVDA